MSDLYGLNWVEARTLALAGEKVRRFDWTEWLTHEVGLWWLDRRGANKRIVSSGDFGEAEFFARDWTTAAPGTFDICSRPPPTKPAFFPPGLSGRASRAGSDITLTAALGSGTFGRYVIQFFVNGAFVGQTGASQADEYSLTLAFPDPVASIEFVAVSVLPLPAWRSVYRLSLPIVGYRLTFAGVRIEYGTAAPWLGEADGSIDYTLSGGETEIEFADTIGDLEVLSAKFDLSSKRITYLVFASLGDVGISTELSTPWFDVVIAKTETGIKVPQLAGILRYDEDGYLDLVGEGSGANTFRTSSGKISVGPIRLLI